MLLLILLQVFLATAALGQITISPPSSLTQCETLTLTWTGGNAPYYVYIYPEFYLDEMSFYGRLGPVEATTIPYNVNVPAGRKIRFNVRDSVNPGFDGSAFTDAIDIGSGTSDACLADGPIGTGGILPLPSNTGLPSDFGSFSAPSLAPFPGIATGTGTVISPTASSGSSISTSAPASSFSGSGSIASATSTGLRNGGEPVNGDTPNSEFAVAHPSTFVLGGMIGLVWLCVSIW